MDPLADNYGDSSSDDSSSLEVSPELEVLGDNGANVANVDGEAPPTPDIVNVSTQECPSTSDLVEEEETIIRSRAYQIEMFEESLKRNIIVAMDTGSGKTQVAVLRIQAELEKRSDKIVWFLATTTHLCEQQFRVLRSQIRAAQIKSLTGADNVDTWSDIRIWDDFLKGVHIVVSTYQVLLDAVTHGFVPISRLSLIVFDEAHNCVGRHPGSIIMQRYRTNKAEGLLYPAILGLTASPIMKSKPSDIDKLEQTLDAVCKAPTVHRDELLATVKRPIVSSVTVPSSDVDCCTNSMLSLASAVRNLDIYKDPWILHLRSEGTERSLRRLREALSKRDTSCIKQMQTLYHRSNEVMGQLGSWAADYYIYTSITRFLEAINQDTSFFEILSYQEKRYLADAIRTVRVEPPRPFDHATASDLSAKFTALVSELQSASDGAKCIIFVRETVTVAVLAHMLSVTPSLKTRFQVGTVVGSSNYEGRKRELGDLSAVKHSLHLDEFRSGKINLLVSTSVAEEGIDVPACNCVICFDAPDNVKSFIQRRGRARADNSKLILLSTASSNKLQEWKIFEEAMRRRYEDDTRIAQQLSELETLDTDSIADEYLYIPRTRARLDFHQAKAHLEHFCQKMTKGQYVDNQPYYVSQRINNPPGVPDQFTATVYLPSSVAPAPRQVKGLGVWYSEKNAFRDAAFQAFKAILAAGLINDNFMPLIEDILEGVETRGSTAEVNSAWKPWPDIAQLRTESSTLIQREICLRDGPKVIAKFNASLPCAFPAISSFNIYWDAQNTWSVDVSEEYRSVAAGTQGEDQSATLLDLAYGHRWAVENSDHVLHLRSSEDLSFGVHVGQKAVEKDALSPEFLIRNSRRAPYSFLEWLPSKPPSESVKRISRMVSEEPADGPWLAVKKWPRPKNLLLPTTEAPPVSDGRYPSALPISHCTVDTIDRSKVYFGAVVPSIIHMFEVYYTAEKLCKTILHEVKFSDLSLVVTAISSRATGLPTDYERFEFFGDSVLKLAATLSVMVQHPNYPEGYLTAWKNLIVSNSRLSRAAIETGLDKFILNENFNAKKWRPFYIKNYISTEDATPSKREMSTKTLADVVEALIGVAFQEGGMPKARACLRTFVPEVSWYDFHDAHTILFDRKQQQQQQQNNIMIELPPYYKSLEEKIIGYTFRNKALLIESLTHSSWQLSRSTEMSMEVLELLGDAVLDSVITAVLWESESGSESAQNKKPELLTNYQMALLRMATVNADLLGFFVMEWRTTQETTSISRDADHATIITETPLPFWEFMRKGSTHVSAQQRAAEERHAAEREAILDAMARDDVYPWAKLAHLSLPKFFSDMFEALLGAVFVDSGSLDACADIVERVGITPYLRRLIADNVVVKHPKNILGELVTSKKVRYETDAFMKESVSDVTPTLDHICTVFVDDELIVRVTGGVNREEIITKAADEACRVLLQKKHKDYDGDDVDEVMTG